MNALTTNKIDRHLSAISHKIVAIVLLFNISVVCFAQTDSLYHTAIKHANSAYEFKWLTDKYSISDIDQFEKARELYAKALVIKPEDKYASDRVSEINRILEEITVDDSCEKLAKKIPLYRPNDLGECFVILDSTLCERTKEEMKALPSRSDMIHYHMGLGMYLRNSWGLWSGSALSEYFKDRGVLHPDNMSGYILDYYYDWLNGDTQGWKNWVEARDKRFEELKDE